MNIDISSLGTAFLTLTTILGAYLLALRIREHYAEKPDPKLTYATINQLNQLTQNLKNYETETQKAILNLRLEIKDDHKSRDNSINHSNENLNKIIRKVIQEVAALSAQNQITLHRINELSIKTDKLLQKVK